MAANGIPESLFIEIFRNTVESIKGLADRVRDGAWNDDDIKLISMCSEVRCLSHFLSVRYQLKVQFPLVQVIKAGYHKNPLILDMVEIVECRALQDLKWKARLQLPDGVFLIGQLAFSPMGA